MKRNAFECMCRPLKLDAEFAIMSFLNLSNSLEYVVNVSSSPQLGGLDNKISIHKLDDVLENLVVIDGFQIFQPHMSLLVKNFS